ncbi:MAG: division/cell wall cluster transcriptional repressor MraZ [Alicyclobacillus sp.]|nr:division/cell wall cluster transcriptional repressor MraZ [Alicyclobacillus sp.]
MFVVYTVKVDHRGRIGLPASLRRQLHESKWPVHWSGELTLWSSGCPVGWRWPH